MSDGLLSIVGTPIGNLSDITPRMRDVFAHADCILCEDTRVSAKLLSYCDIHTPLERCDENVIMQKTPALIERLQQGQHLAFVSDAGMPCISDPGQKLVDAAHMHNISVEVIPGPSAGICALALSGIACDQFFFEGFLPRKAHALEQRLALLVRLPAAIILYESPHRVQKTLGVIAQLAPHRQVALVREITKVHEEVIRMQADALYQDIAARENIKGECVIVIAPSQEDFSTLLGQEQCIAPSSEELDDIICKALEQGQSPTHIAKDLSKKTTFTRRDMYNKVVSLQEKRYNK